MKLGILSRSKKIYSTRRLLEAAEKRGHDVKVVNVLKCYMNITANNPDIYYKTNLELIACFVFKISRSFCYAT